MQARPEWKILVVESDEKPGGTMRSDRVEGCLCEWGPNGFLTNVPYTRDLAHRLDLGQRLLAADESAERRFLWVRGALRLLPMNPKSFLQSDLLSPRGRLRVLLEPFQGRAPKGVEDTVHAFASRRVGSEAASILIDAMVSGVYAGDPEELSLRATFPKMAQMEEEHGSLVKALVAMRRAARKKGETAEGGPAGPGGTLTSFDEGMEVLIQSLAGALGSRLRCGVRGVSVAPSDASSGASPAPPPSAGHAVTVETSGRRAVLSARKVVCAVPSYVAPSLLEGTYPRLARILGEIPYAGLTVVCLIYRRNQISHPLDGFGFLVPRGQGPRMLGCIWTGSIFPGHVTPGRVLLRAMIGGARDPEGPMLSETKTVDVAHTELDRILGGIDGPPVETRLYRHPKGIPQYVQGHLARLDVLGRELASTPGLSLAGNAYRGIGVNDCVRESQSLAARLCAQAAPAPEPVAADPPSAT
jgi:oxygen-dependent protoporphyrinogen oxidase